MTFNLYLQRLVQLVWLFTSCLSTNAKDYYSKHDDDNNNDDDDHKL